MRISQTLFRILLAGTCAFLGTGAAVVANAHANAQEAPSAPNWKSITCNQFHIWTIDRSYTNLTTVLVDSTNVPWHSLGEDIDGLYTDTRTGTAKSRGYIKSDIYWINVDCNA